MWTALKVVVILWLCFTFVDHGEALKCYKCKYELSMASCFANGLETCKKNFDGCFREEKELLRRGGPRVVSAGCGKSWKIPNGCDNLGGNTRCTRWCFKDMCNGTPGKLNKLGQSPGSATSLKQYSVLSFASPVLLAYISYSSW